MGVFDELLDLLLPTRCALCRRLGSAICSDCALSVMNDSHRVYRGDLIGLTASSYGTDQSLLLHRFKEEGQTSLTSYLAGALVEPLRKLCEEFPAPVLVPIPSARANYLKRGYRPTRLLAKSVRRLAGVKCEVVDGLSFDREVKDQAGLDSGARGANLRGAMSANSAFAGRRVILFDDVVTTGSTILEAARAVRAVGGEVVGFLTFSESILKTATKI